MLGLFAATQDKKPCLSASSACKDSVIVDRERIQGDGLKHNTEQTWQKDSYNDTHSASGCNETLCSSNENALTKEKVTKVKP